MIVMTTAPDDDENENDDEHDDENDDADDGLGMHLGGDGDDHHDDDELCTPGITSSYYDNRDCAPPASQVRSNGTVKM